MDEYPNENDSKKIGCNPFYEGITAYISDNKLIDLAIALNLPTLLAPLPI